MIRDTDTLLRERFRRYADRRGHGAISYAASQIHVSRGYISEYLGGREISANMARRFQEFLDTIDQQATKDRKRTPIAHDSGRPRAAAAEAVTPYNVFLLTDTPCPHCGELTVGPRQGAAFCHLCGGQVMAVCPHCGQGNAYDARFCSSCGHALRPSTAAPKDAKP